MKLFALIAFYLVGICMVTVSPGDYTQSQKRRHEIEDLVLEKLKVLFHYTPLYSFSSLIAYYGIRNYLYLDYFLLCDDI